MNLTELTTAFEKSDGMPIIIASKGGTRYWVCKDQLEVNTNEEDPYIYGTTVDYLTPRGAGLRGRTIRQRAPGRVRWFYLRNMKLGVAA